MFLITAYVFLCELFAIPYYILRYLWERIKLPGIEQRSVFITGCDTGFGRSFALKCARNGMTVFAGSFIEKEGESLVKEAESLPGKLHVVPLDVRDEESVKAAAQYVTSQLAESSGLWAIVNNAGVFTFGLDDWCTLKDYEYALDINTLGVIRVTHAFKPLLKRSHGRIVTTASVAGRLTLPTSGPYSVSKYATEAYMDAVRQELRVFGVRCSIIEPGIFKTAMADEGAIMGRINRLWNNMSDEQRAEYGEEYLHFCRSSMKTGIDWIASHNIDWVVDAYFHAVTAKYPRNRYRCGWDAIFYYIPVSLLPTEVGDLLNRLSGGLLTPLPAAVAEKKYA